MPPKPKSNAVAMRASRAGKKQNPELYQAYLQKERDRYQRRKAAGKLPNIKSMNRREARQRTRYTALKKGFKKGMIFSLKIFLILEKQRKLNSCTGEHGGQQNLTQLKLQCKKNQMQIQILWSKLMMM